MIEALEKTGTGSAKILPCRQWLRDNKGAEAERLVAWAGKEDPSPWPEGTMVKALRLLAGAKPDDPEFQGVPPPQGKEASEERLARILAEENKRVIETVLERSYAGHVFAQENSIGAPVKPAGSKPVKG